MLEQYVALRVLSVLLLNKQALAVNMLNCVSVFATQRAALGFLWWIFARAQVLVTVLGFYLTTGTNSLLFCVASFSVSIFLLHCSLRLHYSSPCVALGRDVWHGVMGPFGFL